MGSKNKKSIKRTVGLLKQILKDKNCSHMNLSTAKGYLGELIVMAKLKKESCVVDQSGNQSGYDLKFNNIKIDVKTSTLKKETVNSPFSWGWALKSKSKKRPISCTHFVCVALNKNYEVDSFYIIKKENIDQFPSGIRRFSSVENVFAIPSNDDYSNFPKDLRQIFKTCRSLEKKKKVIKIKTSESLKKLLVK